MTEIEVFFIFGVGLILCFLDWRLGVGISVVAGFSQDVFRKMLPGEPVYLTVVVGIFVMMTCLGAYRRGIPLNFKLIHAWNNSLRLPIDLFIVLVLLQSGVAFLRTGSPIVSGIGLIAYLAPLPAILLGYRFSRNENDIVKFAKIYLVVSVVISSGVYLSYLGYDWDILRSVGDGLFIYSSEGRLTLFSGFLRSPEIAAWHAATAICMILLMLLVKRRSAVTLGIAVALTLFMLGALMFTGRRKFLVEIVLFIAIFSVMLMWFRKGTAKLAYVLLVMTIAGFSAYLYFTPTEEASGMASYYQRGMNIQNEAAGRMSGMTVDSFQYVIAQNGLMGSGAGTGSQGAQHFGGGSEIVGAAAEGGLGKILAELGIPGLIMLLWLTISLVRYLYAILMHVKSGDPARARLTYGLLAFLMANASVYMIAHQIFGDVFVLILLGFCLGFVLAVPRMTNPAVTGGPPNPLRFPGMTIRPTVPGAATKQIVHN